MKYISIENASHNNLKDVSIEIPKEKFVSITGISGSGKSSLAFDLIYKEGQKKYFQALGMALDFDEDSSFKIKGLSPTVAIKQNIIRQDNPRSTLGTKTKALSLLTVLYAQEAKSSNSVYDIDVFASMFSYLTAMGCVLRVVVVGRIMSFILIILLLMIP